jgi:hypothetical protein
MRNAPGPSQISSWMASIVPRTRGSSHGRKPKIGMSSKLASTPVPP